MNPRVQTDDARFLELLERWMQGDFTRADERELYALANADEFRREAWEGFAALPEEDHGSRLAALRARFRQRGGGGRRVTLVPWMAAAAVFVAVLLAWWFFPAVTADVKQSAPMAETEPVSPADMAALEPKGDSSIAVSTEHARINKVIVPLASRSQPTATAADAADDQALVEESVAAKEEKSAEAEAPAAPPPPPPSSKPTDSTSGAVANQPQPSPVSTFPGGPAGNVGPFPGQSTVYKPDSPSPYKNQAKTNAREGARKKSSPAEPATATARPVIGWDAFRQYLNDNARLSDDARNHHVSGFVRIQFVVGQDGQPTNFKTLIPLGYGCEAEAERLIRSISWLPGNTVPVVVDVSFVP